MAHDHLALWQELGWAPSAVQERLFVALQEQLRTWNSRLNLTRLVEGDDYWISQVFDSLWPLVPLLQRSPEEALHLIDVGTGGGFPGLAVAIALPQAQLTLVDSVGRKVEAVRAMALELGLADRVSVRCERIEQTGRGRSCRGQFDWAMARAVASAPVVAEYLVPLLHPQGRALLYRGQWDPSDQANLEQACHPLKAGIEQCRKRDLPGGKGMPAVSLIILAWLTSSARRNPSLNAAATKSSSMSLSSVSNEGSICTRRTSCLQVMVTLTKPEPASPVTSTFPNSSWAFLRLSCMAWACFIRPASCPLLNMSIVLAVAAPPPQQRRKIHLVCSIATATATRRTKSTDLSAIIRSGRASRA